MNYRIETVPMPQPHRSSRKNPLAEVLRQLEVGQSILVREGDPNYRVSLVSNLNQTDKPKHWFQQKEKAGLRIFRDR